MTASCPAPMPYAGASTEYRVLSAFLTELCLSTVSAVLGPAGAGGRWAHRAEGRGQHGAPGAP